MAAGTTDQKNATFGCMVLLWLTLGIPSWWKGPCTRRRHPAPGSVWRSRLPRKAVKLWALSLMMGTTSVPPKACWLPRPW